MIGIVARSQAPLVSRLETPKVAGDYRLKGLRARRPSSNHRGVLPPPIDRATLP